MTGPTPLAEIERRVQRRAKDEALDLDAGSTEGALRTLVADEIARWNDDFRRGERAFPLADADLVGERAMRNLVGYGPLGPLIADFLGGRACGREAPERDEAPADTPGGTNPDDDAS